MDIEKKTENISIHPFNDFSSERLTGLSETTYAKREISDPVYLDWEYFQNPDGKAVISIASEENKIVSQYLVLPRSFSIDNKIVKGSLSVNTLTHPGYRGRGLFPGLVSETFNRCREDKIQFTIGFPNAVLHPLIIRKELFETAGYLPLLFKPLNPIRSVSGYFSGRRNKTGDEIELKISDKIFSANGGISVFNFSSDSENYNEFLESFCREKENVTFRSPEFLKWRYSDIPKRKYHLLKLEQDKKIKTLAIFRARYMFGMRAGVLMDLISLKDSGRIGNLFDTIHTIAVENKLDFIISTILSHSPEYKIMKKAGYYSVPQSFLPQKIAFIVQRHLSSCPEQVSDFKKWYLTFGDYDIF